MHILYLMLLCIFYSDYFFFVNFFKIVFFLNKLLIILFLNRLSEYQSQFITKNSNETSKIHTHFYVII